MLPAVMANIMGAMAAIIGANMAIAGSEAISSGSAVGLVDSEPDSSSSKGL